MLRRTLLSAAPLHHSVRQAARRAYHPSVLPSLLSTSSPEFVAKSQAMDSLVAEFEAKVAAARLGGGAKAAERMRSKGKKLPRERYRVSEPFHMVPRVYPVEQVSVAARPSHAIPRVVTTRST